MLTTEQKIQVVFKLCERVYTKQEIETLLSLCDNRKDLTIYHVVHDFMSKSEKNIFSEAGIYYIAGGIDALEIATKK
jgi:hypothetical protein